MPLSCPVLYGDSQDSTRPRAFNGDSIFPFSMATPLFPLTMMTPLILVQLFITNGDYPVFTLYTKMATPLVPLDVLAPVESL